MDARNEVEIQEPEEKFEFKSIEWNDPLYHCILYTSPSQRDS